MGKLNDGWWAFDKPRGWQGRWPYLLTGGLHVQRIVQGHLWLLYYRGDYYTVDDHGTIANGERVRQLEKTIDAARDIRLFWHEP